MTALAASRTRSPSQRREEQRGVATTATCDKAMNLEKTTTYRSCPASIAVRPPGPLVTAHAGHPPSWVVTLRHRRRTPSTSLHPYVHTYHASRRNAHNKVRDHPRQTHARWWTSGGHVARRRSCHGDKDTRRDICRLSLSSWSYS